MKARMSLELRLAPLRRQNLLHPIPSARGFVVYADGVNLALLPVPTHFISVFETAISGYWIVYQR